MNLINTSSIKNRKNLGKRVGFRESFLLEIQSSSKLNSFAIIFLKGSRKVIHICKHLDHQKFVHFKIVSVPQNN